MRARGEYAERARQLEEVRERNAQKIEQRPEMVFEQSDPAAIDLHPQRHGARGLPLHRRRGALQKPDGAAGGVARAGTAGAGGEGRARQVDEPARYTTREMLGGRVAAWPNGRWRWPTGRTHGVRGGHASAVLERHGYLSAGAARGGRHHHRRAPDRGADRFRRSRQVGGDRGGARAWQAEGYRVLGGGAVGHRGRESGAGSRGSRAGPWRRGRRAGSKAASGLQNATSW